MPGLLDNCKLRREKAQGGMSTSDRETGRRSWRRSLRCPSLLARNQGYNAYGCACFAFFFFFFNLRTHFWSWVNVLRAFFLTFRRVGGSEKRVHSVHLVHRRLERNILPSKLGKNEIWRRNDWEPMAQFVVEWRIVAGGLCTWRWQFFVMDREKCLWGCVTKMCTLKKISFWRTAEERRVLPSQRNPPAKIMLAKFLRQNDSKRLYVVSLHCWRCGSSLYQWLRTDKNSQVDALTEKAEQERPRKSGKCYWLDQEDRNKRFQTAQLFKEVSRKLQSPLHQHMSTKKDKIGRHGTIGRK